MSRDGKPSFWTTLPGIFAQFAAVVVAVTGFIALFMGDDSKPNDRGTTRVDWARQANAICAESYADIRALGDPKDQRSQLRVMVEKSRILTRGNARLHALQRPQAEKDQERIDRLLEAASQANVAYKNAYAVLKLGRTGRSRLKEEGAHPSEVRRLNSEVERGFWAVMKDGTRAEAKVRRLNRELGATVCADGP